MLIILHSGNMIVTINRNRMAQRKIGKLLKTAKGKQIQDNKTVIKPFL